MRNGQRLEMGALAREPGQLFLDACERLLALHPMLVLNKQMLDWDIPRLLARKIVLDEKVAAGSAKSTLCHFFSPKGVVEPNPIRNGKCLLVLAGVWRPQEDVISEE